MKKLASYLWTLPLLGTTSVSCIEEQSAVFIEAVVPLDDNCSPALNDQKFQGLLDIGGLPNEASDYDGALLVTSNLPATVNTQVVQQDRTLAPNYPNYGVADTNSVILRSAMVYFTDARGEPLVVEGVTPESPRETPIGAAVYNIQTNFPTSAVAQAPLITQTEARALQTANTPALAQIPELVALESDPTNRFRINANVRLSGRTSGGMDLVSREFSFPIELCRRCLSRVGMPAGQDQCEPGTNLAVFDVCAPGQDDITSACQ